MCMHVCMCVLYVYLYVCVYACVYVVYVLHTHVYVCIGNQCDARHNNYEKKMYPLYVKKETKDGFAFGILQASAFRKCV